MAVPGKWVPHTYVRDRGLNCILMKSNSPEHGPYYIGPEFEYSSAKAYSTGLQRKPLVLSYSGWREISITHAAKEMGIEDPAALAQERDNLKESFSELQERYDADTAELAEKDDEYNKLLDKVVKDIENKVKAKKPAPKKTTSTKETK